MFIYIYIWIPALNKPRHLADSSLQQSFCEQIIFFSHLLLGLHQPLLLRQWLRLLHITHDTYKVVVVVVVVVVVIVVVVTVIIAIILIV